jgi:hypothetical protein
MDDKAEHSDDVRADEHALCTVPPSPRLRERLREELAGLRRNACPLVAARLHTPWVGRTMTAVLPSGSPSGSRRGRLPAGGDGLRALVRPGEIRLSPADAPGAPR